MNNARKCMSDSIRDDLASRILRGTLPPGARLVELDLAKQFDTSQTPVREALRELETLRLVESKPYRGTRVRAISDREMTEAYALRGVLEQFAAELTAPRLKNNTAELKKSVVALHAAAVAGDIDGYCRHNFDFHRRIVEASDNEMLVQAWQALAFEARVRIHLARSEQPNLPSHAAEHDPILDALNAGKGAVAGRLLREHAQSCLARWSEHRPSEDEAPSADRAAKRKLVHAGVLS